MFQVWGLTLQRVLSSIETRTGLFVQGKTCSKVPRLGPKAFEQAAGFLRIRDGENPLDASAVHPESYSIVDSMARDLACSVTDLMRDEGLRKKIDVTKYVTENVGLPTLNDIVAELSKPGRDPREQFESVQFAEGVHEIEDVRPGMKLPGVVTNITNFGVFVDIGVHQDGLIHVSELANRFVKNPNDVVKVHQKVMVTVLDVDLQRKRISLSMKEPQAPSEPKKKENPAPEKAPKSRPERPQKGPNVSLTTRLPS